MKKCLSSLTRGQKYTQHVSFISYNQSIIDNSFIPNFKEKRYFEGTKDGLKKIIENLKTKLKK